MKLCEKLKAYFEITIRIMLAWLLAATGQDVAVSNGLEEFRNQDPAVFACHIVFICVILFKDFEWAFIVGAGRLCCISVLLQNHFSAIQASTLLHFTFVNYTHGSTPFPFLHASGKDPFLQYPGCAARCSF